jgi:micrococcal nuclease
MQTAHPKLKHYGMKVLTSIAWVAISATLFASQLPAQAEMFAKVVSIGDGDTLTVQQSNRKVTIRLACVDAPERAQTPWGAEATAKLKGLLPIGQQVRIREVEKDKYGRTVGEVFVGNRSINLTLAQAGAAVVYRQYLKGCAGNEKQYLTAEQQARSQRIGFWNQPNPVMPWAFRRGSGARKPPASTSKPKPVGQQFPACVNSDCNCSDFESRAQVDAVFRAYPGDPFRLDGDSDGVPCESIRS